jgi:Phage integrase, N-terminal SAM-like domain
VDVAKRSYGTGSLYIVRDARGREIWYGRWWGGGRRIKRKLGLKRPAGSRDGLTRTQAERALQQLIDSEVRAAPEVRVGVGELGRQLVDHLESLGRKRSTTEEYRSYLAVHLAPFFAGADIDNVTPARIEAFIAAKRREGAATKSILNYLGLLHSIFEYGVRRGYATVNVQAGREAGALWTGAGHPLSGGRRA